MVLRFEPLVAPSRGGELELSADDSEHPRVVPRLLDEIARAAPHRFDREIDGGPSCHDDDRRRAFDGLQPREKIEPFLSARGVAGVIEINEDEAEFLFADGRQRGLGRVDEHRRVALAFQEEAQRLAHGGLIVGDENARSRGGGKRGHAAHTIAQRKNSHCSGGL